MHVSDEERREREGVYNQLFNMQTSEKRSVQLDCKPIHQNNQASKTSGAHLGPE